MELQVNQLIIHELEKAADSADAEVFLSETPLVIEERAEALVHRLNHTFFQKDDIIQGYFSSPEDALFPGAFQVMAEEQFREPAFLAFSRETMNALQLALQGVIGAKGGYLVYADYYFFGSRTIGVFLVRDTEGLVFRKDSSQASYEVDTVTYLNIEKLAMACRIHVDRFKMGNERCLEVIKHAKSQKEVSDYFLNWIGLERPESSSSMTGAFLEVVDHLPLPVDQETGETMAENHFRREVFAYAMTNPQKTINIEEFDTHFYGEEQKTREYLRENEIEMAGEFRFDRGLMKQLYHFRLAAEGMNLTFNRDHLETGAITLEEDAIVIRSPEMVRRFLDLD